MIRRSRISVRPNVRPPGRTPASVQDAPQTHQPPQASDDPVRPTEAEATTTTTTTPSTAGAEQARSAPSEAEDKGDTRGTQPEKASPGEDGIAQIGEAAASGAPPASGPQRRKRFAVLPNLATPRAAAAPPGASSRSPVEPGCPPEPPTPASTAEPWAHADGEAPQAARLPARRRPSAGARQARARPSLAVPQPAAAGAEAASREKEDGVPEDALSQSTNHEAASPSDGKGLQSEPASVGHEPSQGLETPPAPPSRDLPITPEKAPPSLSEKSTPSPLGGKAPPRSSTLTSRPLNDPSDLLRLAKARKLRELLKKEMNKETKLKKKKHKLARKERKAPKDRTKMTMRELIYYLPQTNPMKCYADEDLRLTEIVCPPSPRPASPGVPAEPAAMQAEAREKEVREVQEEVQEEVREVQEEVREVQEEVQQEEEGRGSDAEPEPEQDDQLMVPRVKVAEDGTLIIDEESLTVEVLRVKGPNLAEERDPIFERGSTTTYSSFRKGSYTKPWSNKETDMFFLAISMVGTDFSMIGSLFPHRARIEIKNKFKKEERANSWRIDKAFKEKQRLDLDLFSKLLQKILDEEMKGKKRGGQCKGPKTPKKKPRGKKRRKASGVEEGSGEALDSDVMEGEKENEDCSNDKGSAAAPTKRKRGGGEGGEASPKKSKKLNQAEELGNHGDGGPPEGQPTEDRLKKPEEERKAPAIKPAQLRGRPQRPAPSLGRGWGRRGPEPRRKPGDGGAAAGEQGGTDGAPKTSPGSRGGKDRKAVADVISCGEEDQEEEPDLATVQEQILNKPTRSGRIPKLSQHVMRAAEEEEEEDEAPPLSPERPTTTGGRGRGPQGPSRRSKIKPGPSLKQKDPRRGKSKLVTLRASTTVEEDGEEEEEEEEEALTQEDYCYPTNPEEQNQAPAFVPMSLRSPQPVTAEVEETMEELDILLNVPDVLVLPQHEPCPESSCERAQEQTGAAPCEHQLDLLVDVIDFLSPEHIEVSEESYNEAAQTLLAIGNPDHITQETHSAAYAEVIIVEESSSHAYQDVIQQEVVISETTDQLQQSDEPSQTVTSDFCVSDVPECAAGRDLISPRSDSVPELQSCDPPTEEVPPTEEEPVRSQEDVGVPSNGSHQASDTGVSEQNVTQTRRNRLPKPKPNLGRASRSTRALPRQNPTETSAVPQSLQTWNPTEPSAVPQSLHIQNHTEPSAVPQSLHIQSPTEPSAVPQSLHIPNPTEPSAVPQSLHIQNPTEPSAVPQSLHIQNPTEPSAVPQSLHIQSPTEPSAVPQSLHIPNPTEPSAVPQSLHIQNPTEPSAVPQSLHIQNPTEPSAVPQSLHIQNPTEPSAVPQSLHIQSPTEPSAVPQSLHIQNPTEPSALPQSLQIQNHTEPSGVPQSLQTWNPAETSPVNSASLHSSTMSSAPESCSTLPAMVTESVTSPDGGKNDDTPKERVSGARERAEESAGPEEERLLLQLTQSAGDSREAPPSSECCVPPAVLTRRNRLPKPKPNLGRASRPTRTQSRQNLTEPSAVNRLHEKAAEPSTSTLTDTRRAEGGADVTVEMDISRGDDPQRAGDGAVITDTPGVAAVSTKDVSGSGAEVLSADLSLHADPASADPIFIISLTEVLAPLVDGAGCVAELLPFSSVSELCSEPHNDDGVMVAGYGEVSHLIITDALIPVTEEQEEREMEREEERGVNERGGWRAEREMESEVKERETEREEGRGLKERGKERPMESEVKERGMEREERPIESEVKEGAMETAEEMENREQDEEEREEERFTSIKEREPSPVAHRDTIVERAVAQHVEPLLNPGAEGKSEEADQPQQRRKLPERTRRAKIQVKPTPPARRASSRNVPALKTTPPPVPVKEVSLPPVPAKKTTPPSVPVKDTTSPPVPAQASPEPSHPAIPSSPARPSCSTAAASEEPAPGEPLQGTVGQPEVPGREEDPPAGAESTEDGGSGAELQAVHHITPLAASGPLTRPGRRPRGFLSFISNTSTQGLPGAPRGAKPAPQRPQVNAARSGRKRIGPGTAVTAAASSSPASRVINPSPANPKPATSECASTSECPQVSDQREVSCVNPETDEEPTSVSEYFFSDIFTEVEEME